MFQVNANASLTVSLAQTPYCKKNKYDPQNPLCAHIIFAGTVVKVSGCKLAIHKVSGLLVKRDDTSVQKFIRYLLVKKDSG